MYLPPGTVVVVKLPKPIAQQEMNRIQHEVFYLLGSHAEPDGPRIIVTDQDATGAVLDKE